MENLEKREVIQQYTGINTGIYIRVDKENILLENLDIEHRKEWLDTLDAEGLKRCANILINTLDRGIQYMMDGLDSQTLEYIKEQLAERDEEDEE